MCEKTWCVNRGTEKFTGAYSTNREKGTYTTLTHAQHSLKCIWTCFKRAQDLLSVSVFAHACYADIHIHAIHMLLSKTADPYDLLFTLTELNMDDIHYESNGLVMWWSISGIRLTERVCTCYFALCVGLQSVHFQQLNNGMPVQPEVCLNGVWILGNTCNLLGMDEKSEQRENAF